MTATRSCDQPLTADRLDYGSPLPNPITPSLTYCTSSIDLSTKTNAPERKPRRGQMCHTFLNPPSYNNQPPTEWPMCFSLKSNLSAVKACWVPSLPNHWQNVESHSTPSCWNSPQLIESLKEWFWQDEFVRLNIAKPFIHMTQLLSGIEPQENEDQGSKKGLMWQEGKSRGKRKYAGRRRIQNRKWQGNDCTTED